MFSRESSAGRVALLPSVARIPQVAHMMRQGPTAAVLLSTDLGEMKIPEPMMVPTMMQMPLTRPTLDMRREEWSLPPGSSPGGPPPAFGVAGAVPAPSQAVTQALLT